LDLKLLECGFFKLIKEKLLYETQDKLEELAMDMGLAEATMENCQSEIQKQTDVIYELTVELTELTRQCKLTHDELAAAKALVEEDLRVINLILNVSREECVKMGVKVSAASASLLTVHACLGHDGKTYFETGSSLIQDQASKLKTVSSQQAFQRALFELYGMDSPLPGKLNLKNLTISTTRTLMISQTRSCKERDSPSFKPVTRWKLRKDHLLTWELLVRQVIMPSGSGVLALQVSQIAGKSLTS